MKQAKAKLIFAAIALFLCLSLFVSATFAWIVLSRAPEITGIDTNVGANGGLEIALLSPSTFQNPSLITTKIGDSAETTSPELSNLTWGNILDLTPEGYGLSKISLLPASLNLQKGADGAGFVGSSYLMIPQYGLDGRIEKLIPNTVSGGYATDRFVASLENPHYGVRAVGYSDDLSEQQIASAAANSSILANMSASNRNAQTTLERHGAGLMGILVKHYIDGSDQFDYNDILVLSFLTDSAGESLDYIESSLRQGAIGFMAAWIDDPNEFFRLKSICENPNISLRQILTYFPVSITELEHWVEILESDRADVSQAQSLLDGLSWGSYSWQQVSGILGCLIDLQNVFVGNSRIDDWVATETDTVLTLAPGSGVFADIADFTGDLNALATYEDKLVEITTITLQIFPYLRQLYAQVSTVGATGSQTETTISDIYGFAIDMAFRTNADDNSLLLRTFDSQRIDPDATDAATQGSGSYMVFSEEAADYDDDRMVELMDAVRVGFVDTKGELLGVAKLNTSNWESTGDGIKAFLYLYSFSVSDGGKLIIGERQDPDSRITPLARNVPTAITVLVWLDGDYVSNYHALSTKDHSLSGKLNLQFASEVELHPADSSIGNGE